MCSGRIRVRVRDSCLVRSHLIIAAVALTTALMAALAFESVYRISITPRPGHSDSASPRAATRARAVTTAPLPLRLVDSGGVGIPLTGHWGGDYSHDPRIFREVILDAPPYVDAAAFQRVERDWHAYVERMIAYGNNAIAVPMLLELIDFDRVKTRGWSLRCTAPATRRSARGTRPSAARSARSSSGPRSAACRCSSRPTC